ncbi:hypothetical protein [Microcoleus sp. CAWBG640]|uniref:hypothetical protein n=1 Tax=Microcoleus sp. CAWBG640 TaxID=2841653 RepID=UPI00312B6347
MAQMTRGLIQDSLFALLLSCIPTLLHYCITALLLKIAYQREYANIANQERAIADRESRHYQTYNSLRPSTKRAKPTMQRCNGFWQSSSILWEQSWHY